MFDAMRAGADRLGFELHPSDPGYFELYSTVSMSGTYEGVLVVIERIAALNTLQTRALLEHAPKSKLAITREGLGEKLASLVGFKDLQIGEPDFDQAFRIKGEDAAAITALLTPDVRKQLWAFHSSGCSFKVTDQFVELDRTYFIGQLWTAEQAVADVAPAVALAQAISAASR